MTTSELTNLDVGASRTFENNGRIFTVKRLSLDTWHLRDHAVHERSRFGSRAEIMEDLASVLDGAGLPRSGQRW